ncbi:hypothetical protein [Allohahella sp. A8]|uniref:hypothetical protein n=1 Tax=Allohahella sp. A8 TaxID=3141461 RepID=UPI003A8021FB
MSTVTFPPLRELHPVRRKAVATTFIVPLSLLLPSFSQAEVKSLTSDELTETYIKDSTIIVTPAAAPQPERQSMTYTITPGQPTKTEPELQADLANATAEQRQQLERAIDAARQANLESPFVPPQEVAVAPLREPIPIPFGVEIPEGPFDLNTLLGQQGIEQLPYGDQLNLVNNGEQLIMTIGNIPGYAPLQVDEAIRGRFMEVIPLPQGGAEIRYNLDALQAR